MSDHSSLRARLSRLLASIAACVLVFWPAAASAHTDFESSTPTDGETVDGPLSEVIVEFTNPAEPAGEGFELLDPSGVVRAPTSIDPTDGTAFVLTFDPALSDGTYGLRWQVRAGDAHPIDGSFSFTVVGAAPTTTTRPRRRRRRPAPSAVETTVPAIVAPSRRCRRPTSTRSSQPVAAPPTMPPGSGGSAVPSRSSV
ncbi:MAG: copper resistance protein CopC [Ilumatobacteraceae bacterium]